MDKDNDKQSHEECVAELKLSYHRYKLGFRGYKQQPLDYHEWLEHTAVRLAERLGEADEALEDLQEECERYKHAADANHDCWQEATRKNNSLYGVLAAVRVAAIRGDVNEVARLLMVWACWN